MIFLHTVVEVGVCHRKASPDHLGIHDAGLLGVFPPLHAQNDSICLCVQTSLATPQPSAAPCPREVGTVKLEIAYLKPTIETRRFRIFFSLFPTESTKMTQISHNLPHTFICRPLLAPLYFSFVNDCRRDVPRMV